MRGSKAYKAYTNGAQYGKFGSGDHKSEGGKVVKGVTGKIHIQGGIETDIMKTHGANGEYILAQRKGYPSLSDVPRNEITGYAQYGDDDNWWDKTTDWLFGSESIADKYISDPLQKLFGVSADYDPDIIQEKEQKGQLKTMLGTSQENIIEGQKKTEEFIGDQLQQTLAGFGRQENVLDTKTTALQRGLGTQYQAGQNIQTKTGLITSDAPNIRRTEDIGVSQMKGITGARENIWAGMEGAETQAEMDIYKSKQQAQSALAQIYSDYMAATGETISDEQMTLFSEYMQDNDVTINPNPNLPQSPGGFYGDEDLEELLRSGNIYSDDRV
jgi:hypothetical protein